MVCKAVDDWDMFIKCLKSVDLATSTLLEDITRVQAEKELRKTYITRIESRVMKTVATSGKVLERLETLVTEWSDTKQDDLLMAIGKPVLEHLRSKKLIEETDGVITLAASDGDARQNKNKDKKAKGGDKKDKDKDKKKGKEKTGKKSKKKDSDDTDRD